MKKINFEVQQQGNEYVIAGNHENLHWLVEIVFEENEKQIADMMCKKLNEESERAYDLGDWNARKEIFDRKGVI